MTRFSISQYGMADFLVELERRNFYLSAISDAKAVVSEAHKSRLLGNLKKVRTTCALLEMVSAIRSIDHIIYTASNTIDPRYQDIAPLLHALWHGMTEEVAERYCAFIPSGKTQYFEQDALFGEAVNKAFPEAVSDIKDAGNCLAADLPTAAVFHLMRVAELGLRVLSKSIRAKLPMQIEYLTWGQIIAGIDRELNKLKGKSPAKDKKVQLYSTLLLEINAFKGLWRNPVMHARSRYDEHNALSAASHVRTFMQRLAEQQLTRRGVQ